MSLDVSLGFSDSFLKTSLLLRSDVIIGVDFVQMFWAVVFVKFQCFVTSTLLMTY